MPGAREFYEVIADEAERRINFNFILKEIESRSSKCFSGVLTEIFFN